MRRSFLPVIGKHLCAAIAIFAIVFGPVSIALAEGGPGVPANAPPVGGGMPIYDAAAAVSKTYDNIWTQIARAGVVAFYNALQNFFGKIAFDAANYIASGGKGQDAVFYKKGVGPYLADVGKDAAGSFVESLSGSDFFKTIGENVCKPKDPRALLNIQLNLGNFFPGLQSRYSFPGRRDQKALCSFNDVVKNYEQLADTMSNSEIYSNIGKSLETNSGDLGVQANIANLYLVKVGEKVQNEAAQRAEGRGFKGVTRIISGTIKTPAELVQEQSNEIVRKPNQDSATMVGAMLGNAFKEGPLQLAQYTASVFLNTLASKMLKRIFDKGLDAFDFSDMATQALGNPEALVTAGKTDVRNANIDLKQPIVQKVAEINTVAELIACPSSNRGLWNCTADQSFAKAIQGEGDKGGVTVAEAIQKNLLHPDWKLIPDTMVKENQDPQCYTYAYCVGNLQKMRALRILPVGFEFAANSEKNKDLCASGGCATLGEVAKNFSICNADGARDAAHPWCHLIDPNWVITHLPEQCALSGFSDNLLDPSLPQRREECADIQTCLKRNAQGECVGGYGYCAAEKTAYRFGNAQECETQYASCRIYQTRAGKAVPYLRNTLDFGTCSAENAGCLWYSTERVPDRTTSSTNWWNGDIKIGPRMYFDKGLQPCSASNEGCTRLAQAEVGKPALNLLLNPSFEHTTGSAAKPTLADWLPDDTLAIKPNVGLGSDAVTGDRAFPVSGKDLIQRAAMEGARMYTLSFYARLIDASQAASVKASAIQFKDPDFKTPVKDDDQKLDFRSNGCVPRAPGSNGVAMAADQTSLVIDWQRYECSFLSNISASSSEIHFSGANALLDGVQLEESEFATDFVDGLNPALPMTSLKIAPLEFQCRGEANDHESCSKFAKACRQPEAGCQGYADSEGGGSEIPAIANANDQCPGSCVGYAEYRKRPSAFDLVHDADQRFDDPNDFGQAFFIPKTAQACEEESVGCSAMTSVEPAEAGGESQMAFTYVRACEKPAADSKTFFTWEGSDQTGYQLRTWSLKRDQKSEAPKIIEKRAPDQASFKEPSTCNNATWKAGIDPDCRQFYDASGAVYYAYYSQTVLSSESCTDFRLNASNANDCGKTGGTFNPNTAECVYHVFLPESRTCSQKAIGCRAWNGPQAGNTQIILSEHFRNGLGSFKGGTISKEALLVGDSSLKLDAGQNITATIVTSTPSDIITVSFWAKSPATPKSTGIVLKISDPNDPKGAKQVGQTNATADWQRFTIGPFNGWPDSAFTRLEWSVPAKQLTYIDEVEVTRIHDSVFVKMNTWNTPNECDMTAQGVPLPQAMLGCREYHDRNKNVLNLRQFSRLCREQAIGCREFIDTRNSDNIAAQTFALDDTPPDSSGPTVTVRPASRYIYLIDEASKHCQPEETSCRAFGRPKFLADRSGLDPANPSATNTQFTTVYFKDDISKYGTALCRKSELFCDAFAARGGTEYFKDPQNHACEYRENIVVEADAKNRYPKGTYFGWFIQGTETPCYPDAIKAGTTFDLARNGDSVYAGWGGLCPQEEGECTEFRDPNDTSDPLHRDGKPYYFIRNSDFDDASADCNGRVDVAQGCILLRNTNEAGLKYQVGASYDLYRSKNFNPIAPLDCNNPANASLCKGKQCAGTLQERDIDVDGKPVRVIDTQNALGRVCTSDADCTYTYADALNPDAADNPDRLVKKNYSFVGLCSAPIIRKNDANLLIKANVDRDCAEWLGCKSAETVYDQSAGKYKDVCTSYALCDKASEKPGDIFCAHYVDRDTTSAEPTLTAGAFFDIDRYAKRRVGLGEKDFSGYAVPDAFQSVDLVNARVAADGLSGSSDAKYRYALEYRLSAAVRMPRAKVDVDNRHYIAATVPSSADMAIPLSSATVLGKQYPDLFLCQQVGTGIVGFYRVNEGSASEKSNTPFFCYLPVRVPEKGERKDDAFDFPTISQKFALTEAEADPFLSQAYPPASCRAHPESDAPFSASYVTEWDMSKVPPQPKNKLSEFASANTCEYGENCVCTYKRVDFSQGAPSKFYSIYSPAVLTGVCVGGPRDGQSCLPETVYKLPATKTGKAGDGKTDVQIQASLGSNVLQTCGPPEGGGRCVAANKIQIVKGTFGECLERDLTREIRLKTADGLDILTHPCLTWNPTPILFGDKDANHYIPTAGYMPPQNSGQYYCLSPASSPKIVKLEGGNDGSFVGSCDEDWNFLHNHLNGCKAGNPPNPFAGGMYKFSFDDRFIAGGSSQRDFLSGIGGIIGGAGILGQLVGQDPGDAFGAYLLPPPNNPDGTQSAAACHDARDEEVDDSDQHADIYGLRLVDSGRSLQTAYTETFFRLKNPIPELDAGSSISFIGIAPISNPSGKGRLWCGYQPSWVSGLDKFDASKGDELAQKDQEFREKFFQDYNQTLTRGGEEILENPNAPGHPYGLACSFDAGKKCFVKYWQTDYHSQDQKTFKANDKGDLASLENIRLAPIGEKCDSDTPYFSIRAVFEQEFDPNALDPAKIVTGQVPSGPWRLSGFWVSTCGGHEMSHYMYMNVNVNYGDICTQLAEVRSRDSHQDAAFTDRVWKNAGYILPGLGFQYAGRYAPFDSALNIAPAGKDPLFQTGGSTAGFSRLRPPAFLSPGAGTYFINLDNTPFSTTYPNQKWAYLTNLFARIYRIYTYYIQPVLRGDYVCRGGGPNDDKKCVPDAPGGTKSAACDVKISCAAPPVGQKYCLLLNGKHPGDMSPDADYPHWNTMCTGQGPGDEECQCTNGNCNKSNLRCRLPSAPDVSDDAGPSGLRCPNYPMSWKPCDPNNPSCGPAQESQGYTCEPVSGPAPAYAPTAKCLDSRGDPSSPDPDTDNNKCTHGTGYYPIPELCPDSKNEFCGLFAYNIADKNPSGSLDPFTAATKHPLPTDVTPGLYTPLYLGLKDSGRLVADGPNNEKSEMNPQSYRYVSYYTPRPPRVAAPDARHCPSPGTCPIQKTDGFSVDGQSEGILDATGGQHQATLRFYGWASHNQMPLRQLVIDWGDGSKTELNDSKLKNHKPLCNVTRECSDPVRGQGITCQTDADCPAGSGQCVDMGTCQKKQNVFCSSDADCKSSKDDPDVCRVRTMFGNSSEACEQNYFEFAHLYSCKGQGSLPSCTQDVPGTNPVIPSDYRCSRDPNRVCDPKNPLCAAGDTCVKGLANNDSGGCWDQAVNSCRFTPRVLLQDNWGWCTGECRTQFKGGAMEDQTDPALLQPSHVLHQYGGCYAWSTLGEDRNVNFNNEPITLPQKSVVNECDGIKNPQENLNLRPWMVYPGALQLRSSGEVVK